MTITRIACLLSALLLSAASRGQLANCNGFIKGDYLEAGINWNGAFGSSTPPPAGFHPERTSSLYDKATCGGFRTDSSIAFVADIDKDGWYTGTPTRFGDYILPGIAMEGWSYMADGVQSNAWNNIAATQDSVTGIPNLYFMSYADTLGVKTLKFQAVQNGVYITQIFTMKPGDLYIQDEVVIENTNLFTIYGIYFMRLFNAHPDQAISGVAESKSKIEHTLPDSLNRTVISCRGTVNPNGYMAIATQDPRAIGFISTSSPTPSATMDNISSLTEGGFLYGQNDSVVGNTASGILFDLGNLPSVGVAHFTLLYAFSPKVFDSTLNTVDSESSVVDIRHSEMNVFPNPSLGQLTITGLAETDQLLLLDIIGREMPNALRKEDLNHYWMAPEVLAGTYVLTIKDQRGLVVKRQQVNKM